MPTNELVMTPPTLGSFCANIKSRKHNTEKCPNPATHGAYCGVHQKNPKPWKPSTPAQIAKAASRSSLSSMPITRSEISALKQIRAAKIWKWYVQWRGRHRIKTRGPAYHVRSIATNDTDFFSADPVTDISGVMFFHTKMWIIMSTHLIYGQYIH